MGNEIVSRPDWRDQQVPGKIRVALWLLAEVGEGQKFTKEQLRAAFHDYPHVERRMRELRDHDWMIDANRTDVSLKPNEMRFVRAGEAVWDPATRAARMVRRRPGRRTVLERDGQACVRCGTTVALDVAYVVPLAAGGSAGPDNLVTLCANCHRAFDLAAAPSGEAELWKLAEKLSPQEKARLLAWMALGCRPVSAVEQVWQLYCAAPADRKSALKERLAYAVSAQAGDDEAP
ncbi:HNH endonuclease [Streptomyces syringium]|uniref:HNH endonuclease n=1 Tax=Streptomyces syringium TaxID=76729 RepID=UPI003D8CC216